MLDWASSCSMLACARSENWCSNSLDAQKIDAHSNIVLDRASTCSVLTRSCSENWCLNSLDARKIDALDQESSHYLIFLKIGGTSFYGTNCWQELCLQLGHIYYNSLISVCIFCCIVIKYFRESTCYIQFDILSKNLWHSGPQYFCCSYIVLLRNFLKIHLIHS